MTSILEPGRNCWTIDEVSSSGLLIDGRDYYRAFYRAATHARRFILLAGWQFDRNVALLRGDDAREAPHDVHFLSFLHSLCEKNPELRIYILAWDFSSLFILDREWFQDLVYTWTTSPRLYFRFDNTHSITASHHQKFAVIDGTIGFVGGIDICAQRWDDRNHRVSNPQRIDAKGKSYEPFHDIQACFTGKAAESLTRYFSHRWNVSGGKNLNLAPLSDEPSFEVEPTVSISAHRVALSRTRGRTILPLQDQIREIRNLYVDAIGQAQELIYLENQYISSQAVYQAIIDRIEDSGRPLQIVIILPKKPHSLVENLAMGVNQVKMLKDIGEKCEENGHSIGIYHTRPAGDGSGDSGDGQWDSTFIHAKLLIVDDRLLSVGSANATNRSMGLDTELNVTWEVGTSGDEDLARSIRRVRETLIAEHTGLDLDGNSSPVPPPGDLVTALDELCGERIIRHSLETMIAENPFLENLDPDKLKVDPEEPVVEENVFEFLSRDQMGLFAEGITLLSDLLAPGESPDRRSGKELRDYVRRLLSMLLYVIRNPWRWVILIAILALAGLIVKHVFF